MLRKAIPALLLLCCAVSFAAELNETLDGWDRRASSSRGPHTWRVGIPSLARLTTCLDDVRARVPPGSFIAFASQGEEAFFRARWAAWLLPGHEVLPIEDPSVSRVAEYVIDYRARLDLPRLELVAQLRGCRLFKVRPQ